MKAPIEDIDVELAALVEPLQEQLGLLQEELAQVEADYRSASDGLKRRIKQRERAIGFLTDTPAQPKRKKQAAQSVSDEVVEEVHLYLTQSNGSDHTANEIGEAIGRAPQTVRTALNVLRDQELVRKSRPRDRKVGHGRKADTYALMNGG